MSTTEIDNLVTDFYKSVSFKTGQRPEYDEIKLMFDEEAVLINNSFGQPLRFNRDTFIQSLQSAVADKDMRQFFQHEAYSKTDIFGKVATRVSVYEYSLADHPIENMPRGINFIQCLQVDGKWRILSMAWNDENENHIIPNEYLIV